MIKKIRSILVLLILLVVLILLTSAVLHHPAQTGVSQNRSNYYTQLDIYNTLFGKSQSAKLKLLGLDQINLEGKVFKSNFLKNDEIVVYRIVITCCVADGVPLGLVVKMPATFGKTLSEKDWVNMEGAIKLLPERQIPQRLKTNALFANMELPEKMIPYFIATKITKTAAPGDEYLYP